MSFALSYRGGMRAVGRHCKASGLHIKMMYAPCIKTYTYNDNSESLSVSFSVSCSVSFSMYRFLYRVRWLHGAVGGGCAYFPQQEHWWHMPVWRPVGQADSRDVMDYQVDLSMPPPVREVLAVMERHARTADEATWRRMSAMLRHCMPKMCLAAKMRATVLRLCLMCIICSRSRCIL